VDAAAEPVPEPEAEPTLPATEPPADPPVARPTPARVEAPRKVEPAPAPIAPLVPVTFIPESATLLGSIGGQALAFRRGVLLPPGAVRVKLTDGDAETTCTIWVGSTPATWKVDAKKGCAAAP